MKRTFLLFSFLMLFRLCNFAIPARPVPLLIKQSDGTEITLYLRGDETFHCFYTDDGIPVVQGNDSSYYYAAVKDSTFINSGILAHQKLERNAIENTYINNNREYLLSFVESLFNRNRLNASTQNIAKAKAARIIGMPQTYIGRKKGLVILINFQDRSLTGNNVQNEFNNFFNQKGYNKNNHIGSVHDYFYDQSYGLFDLSFDVIGPVTVSNKISYYGANSSWDSQNDIHVGQMVAEACKNIDDVVDFSKYDWDGDGVVEQVFLIYAGYGESSGAPSYTIWPHKSSLDSRYYYGDGEGALLLDGVKINDYACSCELAGTSGTILNGIGTACHEFSHCLGLPDFYDVNYNGGFGMDAWDLMDAGGHNGPAHIGEVPSGYTAYERWFVGWLSMTELTEMSRIKDMPSIAQSPIAYKITNDNHPDEYYILENRQNEGWFSFVNSSNKCHGLLISHIDYLPAAWMTNSVNTTTNHQRMSIIPADNDYGYFYNNGTQKRYLPSEIDLLGDLFPGSREIREFTDDSHIGVGGKLHNPNTDGSYYLHKPITNIKEYDGKISFDFMGGIYVPMPKIKDLHVTDSQSAYISWDSESDIDSYTIEAIEIRDKNPYECIALSENFNNFKTDEEEGDGTMELSTYLNSYTQKRGWTGTRIHTSPLGAKVGDAKQSGFLMTPPINIEDKNITLKIKVSKKEDMVTPINIILINNQNDTIKTESIICDITNMTKVLSFKNVDKGIYTIGIDSNSPFYIENFVCYYGLFSEKDVLAPITSFIRPLEHIEISGITDTYYTFKNMNAQRYNIRLKAIKEEASSEWTPYAEINFKDVNGIIPVQNSLKEGRINIYTINGIKTNDMSTKGIYIIDNGLYTKKIVIK